MRQILWFRRDLRIHDNAILAKAKDEVLPIFIFDPNILKKLDKDDKRVGFILQSVLKLKEELKSLGLDLAIFHEEPVKVFTRLSVLDFENVLCSIDYDAYAISRDKEIAQILPLKRYVDSFILNPTLHVKADRKPYRVFTPFYKSLQPITSANEFTLYKPNPNLRKVEFEYSFIPTLEELGFSKQKLPEFLKKGAKEHFESFGSRLKEYEEQRDYFAKDTTSNMSVFLRFGLISPKELFNLAKGCEGHDFYIRELFWREFWAYLLFHFPQSEFENFYDLDIPWREDKESFQVWCEGETGIDIVDAAMKCLNQTGLMPNRLRMIVASFLTKNLLIDWREGEAYFAKKLLDYEASSNIGSWQWAASTGADGVPYFRIFNPLTQSEKFDKEGIFIKQYLSRTMAKKPIVSLDFSRKRAIEVFKRAKNANL
ncbi:MAG TPA: deoxyribodipyrimidine photolyase [Sulfurospirillum sp. UBA11407]|nr:MAG TPA: deoxyribodipyrimidine photolyase [Sulfurospirillum sp. UBA11407]